MSNGFDPFNPLTWGNLQGEITTGLEVAGIILLFILFLVVIK